MLDPGWLFKNMLNMVSNYRVSATVQALSYMEQLAIMVIFWTLIKIHDKSYLNWVLIDFEKGLGPRVKDDGGHVVQNAVLREPLQVFKSPQIKVLKCEENQSWTFNSLFIYPIQGQNLWGVKKRNNWKL